MEDAATASLVGAVETHAGARSRTGVSFTPAHAAAAAAAAAVDGPALSPMARSNDAAESRWSWRMAGCAHFCAALLAQEQGTSNDQRWRRSSVIGGVNWRRDGSGSGKEVLHRRFCRRAESERSPVRSCTRSTWTARFGDAPRVHEMTRSARAGARRSAERRPSLTGSPGALAVFVVTLLFLQAGGAGAQQQPPQLLLPVAVGRGALTTGGSSTNLALYQASVLPLFTVTGACSCAHT